MDLIIAIACIGVFIYFLYLIAGYLDAREAERAAKSVSVGEGNVNEHSSSLLPPENTPLDRVKFSFQNKLLPLNIRSELLHQECSSQ